MTSLDPPTRLAIVGSCVTRDALTMARPRRFELTRYIARSALASLSGPQPSIKPNYDIIASPFQRRMVRDDIEKLNREWLSSLEYDVLVYDPIDERFDLAEFADGGLATISQEFRLLQLPEKAFTSVPFLSEEHFSRWQHGWNAFWSFVSALGVQDRVLVHLAPWAEKLEGTHDSPGDPRRIRLANEWLARAALHMLKDLPEDRLIIVDASLHVAAVDHRWGVAPVHYVDAYYKDFLDRLGDALRRCGLEQ